MLWSRAGGWPQIRNCNINSTGAYGVQVEGGAKPYIFKNSITNRKGRGIVVSKACGYAALRRRRVCSAAVWPAQDLRGALVAEKHWANPGRGPRTAALYLPPELATSCSAVFFCLSGCHREQVPAVQPDIIALVTPLLRPASCSRSRARDIRRVRSTDVRPDPSLPSLPRTHPTPKSNELRTWSPSSWCPRVAAEREGPLDTVVTRMPYHIGRCTQIPHPIRMVCTTQQKGCHFSEAYGPRWPCARLPGIRSCRKQAGCQAGIHGPRIACLRVDGVTSYQCFAVWYPSGQVSLLEQRGGEGVCKSTL